MIIPPKKKKDTNIRDLFGLSGVREMNIEVKGE